MKTVLAILTIALIISLWANYDQAHAVKAWQDSYEQAYKKSLVAPPVEHHYQFRVDGASVFRFDENTGATCMVQKSMRDANNGLPYCERKN